MRIGLANDESRDIQALRKLIDSVPGYRVEWVARNGAEAVEKCREDKPDLVLMKLILPVLDGVQATRQIATQCPCPILILAPTLAGHSAQVFEAMGHGALDAVAAPELNASGEIVNPKELLQKIAIIQRLIGRKPLTRATPPKRSRLSARECPLVAIGASTGGPKALATILSRLPAQLGACGVVVQHVDYQFVGGLVSWLNDQTDLQVELAQEGGRPSLDHVYVAGGEDHLVLGADGAFHYQAEPREYPYRPSVDSLFHSLRRHWPRKDLAVLLTGMGRDGAAGLLELRKSGWHTIVQDEQSSTVFGMPKAAIESGAAMEVLALSAISASIIKYVNYLSQETE